MEYGWRKERYCYGAVWTTKMEEYVLYWENGYWHVWLEMQETEHVFYIKENKTMYYWNINRYKHAGKVFWKLNIWTETKSLQENKHMCQNNRTEKPKQIFTT